MSDALTNLKERIQSALSLAMQSEEAAAKALYSFASYIHDDCPKLVVQDEAGHFQLVAWYTATLAAMPPPRTWSLWEECIITLDSLLLATVSSDDSSDLVRWLQSVLAMLQPEGATDRTSNFQIVRAAMAITVLPIEQVSLVSLSSTLAVILEARREDTCSALTDHLKIWLLRHVLVATKTANLHLVAPLPASFVGDISAASRWWFCDARVASVCDDILPLLRSPETLEHVALVSKSKDSVLARLPSVGTPKQSTALCRELSMAFSRRADRHADCGSLSSAIVGYKRAIEIAPASACAAGAAGNLLQVAMALGDQSLSRAALQTIETWIHRVCTDRVGPSEFTSAPLAFVASILYDTLAGQRATGPYVDGLARLAQSSGRLAELVLLLLGDLEPRVGINIADSTLSALPHVAQHVKTLLQDMVQQPTKGRVMTVSSALLRISQLRVLRRHMYRALDIRQIVRTAEWLASVSEEIAADSRVIGSALLAAVVTLLNVGKYGEGDGSDVRAVLRRTFPALLRHTASLETGTVENLTLDYLLATQQWKPWAEFAESCVEASNQLGWDEWLRERESARHKLENVVSEWASANVLLSRSGAEPDTTLRVAVRHTTETVWRALEALHADRFVTALGPLATVGERLKHMAYNLLGGRKDNPQRHTRIATRQDVAAGLLAGEGLLYWHVNDECACFLGVRGEDDATYCGAHTLEDVYDEFQAGRVPLSDLVAKHCEAIRNAHDQCTAADLDDEQYAKLAELQREAYRELGVILGELPNMLEFLKGVKRLFVVVPREVQAVPLGPLPILWTTTNGNIKPTPLAEVVDEVRVVVSGSQVYHARHRDIRRVKTERSVCRGGRLDAPLRPEALAAIDAATSGLGATRVELAATRPTTDVSAGQFNSASVTFDQLLSKPRFALAIVVAHSDQRGGLSKLLCLDGFDQTAPETLLLEDPRGRFADFGPDAAVLLVCNGGELESFAHVLALRSCSTVVASPVKLANPHVMTLSDPSVLNALDSSDWSSLVRAIRQSMQRFNKHSSPESGGELARIHHVQSALPSQLYAVQLYGVPTSAPR